MIPIALTTENVFLTFVKRIIVLAMSLSLLCALGFGGYAAYLFAQRPRTIEISETPVLKAEEVKLGDFIAKLTRDSGKTESVTTAQNRGGAGQIDATKIAKPYLTEATTIYKCSLDFASAVGLPIQGLLPNDEAAQIEVVRTLIDSKSDSSEWAPTLAPFVCAALKSREMIDFRQRNPKSGTLIPIIDFHHWNWKKNTLANAKVVADQEAARRRALSDEDNRISRSRQEGMTAMLTAGILLAVFLSLAMYLVFVRIESNLADISNSLKKP